MPETPPMTLIFPLPDIDNKQIECAYQDGLLTAEEKRLLKEDAWLALFLAQGEEVLR